MTQWKDLLMVVGPLIIWISFVLAFSKLLSGQTQSHTITLTWNPSLDKRIFEQRIYRAQKQQDPPTKPIATLNDPTANSFTDSGSYISGIINSGGSFYYTVSCVYYNELNNQQEIWIEPMVKSQ